MLGKCADCWEIVEGLRAPAVDTEPDMIEDQLEIGMSRGNAIEMIERPWHNHHERNAYPFSRWPYPVCRPVCQPGAIWPLGLPQVDLCTANIHARPPSHS